ncbi:MAG: endonuclease [Melioribacteraceae bacterium]
MKKFLLLLLIPITFSVAQISIQVGSNITENFNNIGPSANASLPYGWKVEKNNSLKSIGNYANALSNTNYAAGINMSSSAANGIYNFEIGNGSTPTDRAVGGISSSASSKSVNVLLFLKNNGNSTITQLDLTYDVMRFRNGTNASGFSIQLYYSKNGITWNSAGDNFITSFVKNDDNNGGSVVPIEQKQILNKTLSNLLVAPNDSLFLAWNYSVTSGATTSNAQALGIDNVAINNILSGDVTTAPVPPNIKPATNITSKGFTANWENSVSALNYYLDVSTTSDFSQLVSGYNNLNVGNSLNKDISPLSANTKYYYRVRAANNIGTSANSSVQSVTTLDTYTLVQFKDMSDAISKMKGSYDLTISIREPSLTSSTSCVISFIADSSSATSSYLNNFTTQTVTFPAGSSAEQTIKLNIADNGVSEIPKKAFLKIDNVSGGQSAKAGSQYMFILSITSGIDKSYYSSLQNNGLNGEALKAALYDLIKNHTKYFYTDNSTPTSIDVWKMLKASDEDPKNPNNVIGIYSGLSIGKEPQTYWNREHVWSKSHGDFGTEIGAGTDAHHLRPENPNINSLKSNLDFDNGGIPVPNATNNKYDGDSWEPRDEVKGDIARMIFYMATRYEGENGEPNLEVVDYIPSSPAKEPMYGKLNTLLKWNLQDPPDDFEINRNNVVYSFQKNRNPFIDYPEWVTSIWGTPNSISKNQENISSTFSLSQNYPNPFNPSTSIKYQIKEKNKVSLTVYDTLGNEVIQLVNEVKPAGKYEVKFNGSKLTSGVYFYQLRVGNFVETKKFVYMK